MSGHRCRYDDGVDSAGSDQVLGTPKSGRPGRNGCATRRVDVGNRSELDALDPRNRGNPAALRNAAAPHQSDSEDRQRWL